MARVVGSGIGVSLWYAKQIRLTNIQPLTMGQFGVSVAISDHNVLIGEAGDGTSGIDVGQAHLFGNYVLDCAGGNPYILCITLCKGICHDKERAGKIRARRH